MTENKGTQNDGLASSSSEPFDPLKFLANLVNFEDTNIVFSDDEIRKIAVEEERFDEVKNLLADLTKTPATNDDDRITQFPTKELEAYYKSCPHPNEQQRRELAKELGLIHLQVLFWFKNKRKQMKNHRARMENYQLRAENKNLKNMKLKENVCLCGKHDVLKLPEEHELRMENKRLKKEYKKLLSKVGNFGLQ